MSFYNLSKEERIALVKQITENIYADLSQDNDEKILSYFADIDTYIRKSAYLAVGKIYQEHIDLQKKIINCLEYFLEQDDYKIRQTVINAAGEIGKKEFEKVNFFFDKGLLDVHHSTRNAVIGSIKKMAEVNPNPVLEWANKYLHHEDKEIRREICHGIELRGRKHPEDILPMLQELQHDKTSRVRNTLVHVIGQIAYKQGCIQKVISHLKTWDNKQLVAEALEEIIDVHQRYKDFAVMTPSEAIRYIEENYE